MNNAGKELLQLLHVVQDINKGTWQHPKSKKWHCIDYSIVRTRNKRRCLDACVNRGAECDTDHQLLRIKMRLSKLYQTTRSVVNPHRYDISKLAGPSLDENGKDTPKGRFQVASKFAKEQWKVDGLNQEKWEVLRSALTDAAKSVLGVEKCRQPDWFRTHSPEEEPALPEMAGKWSQHVFCRARSQAVRAAKNAWFTSKAEEAQRGRFGVKKVWRDMQHGRRGLVPARLATVVDEEGNACTTVEAQQRWRRHLPIS